ncbi:MAG TPA: DUF3037 domain-containing protein [Chryseolinea sp.]|nr:DUF3037 domain-containing protein [Chryseolinea sp.]HPM29764.1 DUF3037 domain-containing protein [Chryseolinea sp.]
MQENQLFEYAVIRVVPKVEREEFLNVGVILLCAKQKFLQARIELNEERLLALSNDVEIANLKKYIHSFELICEGGPKGGTIGKLSLAERFRWLTASRSTILQTSKVHPGLCADANEMLDRLFVQLVQCT